MKSARCLLSFVIILFAACATASYGSDPDVAAAAKDPEQLIRVSIEKGLAVLKDKEVSRSDRREKIRRIMLQAADMDAIATYTLARLKSKFSDAQFREFTELFSRLLFNTYIGHVERYSGDPVQYGKLAKTSDTKVTVPVRVRTDEGLIPVDFSLYKSGDQWKMYDVRVEGVSMVRTYRSDFNEFLVNKPPDALIQQLKKKVTEYEKKNS